MKLEFDKRADAAYLYFKKIAAGEVAKTITLNENFNIDLDAKGRILGMEILNASKVIPKESETC